MSRAGEAVSVRGSSPTGATLTGTAWVPGGDLQLAHWLDYGRRLGALGRGVAWWIGDWLNYGNQRYGEKYTRAAKVTGYDAQSLMNMSYVASRFEPGRRRDQLSWSHHAELAALPPAEQDHWLDVAEAERLSVHSLRIEVRSARRASGRRVPMTAGAGQTTGTTSSDDQAHRVVCPKCMTVIDTPPLAIHESAERDGASSVTRVAARNAMRLVSDADRRSGS